MSADVLIPHLIGTVLPSNNPVLVRIKLSDIFEVMSCGRCFAAPQRHDALLSSKFASFTQKLPKAGLEDKSVVSYVTSSAMLGS